MIGATELLPWMAPEETEVGEEETKGFCLYLFEGWCKGDAANVSLVATNDITRGNAHKL